MRRQQSRACGIRIIRLTAANDTEHVLQTPPPRGGGGVNFNQARTTLNNRTNMTILSLPSYILALIVTVAFLSETATAFAPPSAARALVSSSRLIHTVSSSSLTASGSNDDSNNDVLAAAIDAMYGGGHEMREEPAVTRARIQELVDNNNVLLFMKGSKFFPQCGFSDTATKILETFQVEYETVDVLADDTIREGIKVYSQWPTIPQLYVGGEFIGGSDIMMEMYESGELKNMIETISSDKKEE